MFKRNTLALAAAGTIFMNEAEGQTSTGGGAVEAPKNTTKFSFFFKTEKLKDADGKVIGDGRKHPTVTTALPTPTAEELITYIASAEDKEGEGDAAKPTLAAKVGQMLMTAANDLIYQAARGQINSFLEDDPKGEFNATKFDLSKLTLEWIAQQEPGRRGAWAPSDDEIKVFCEDYTRIMVMEVRYDAKKVATHCDLFGKGLAKIKGEKPIVAKMKEFLAMWAANTEAMDEHQQVYEWLVGRADRYMQAELKSYADSI